MARLRAPGGCPWDARQTHQSLVQYLLEEAYEAAEAIDQGNRDDMREELGDVLLQVVFHSLIAAEATEDQFDIDDLARLAGDKLVRRHPHVFSDDQAEDLSAEESHKRWDRIKTEEKSRRSVLDGIPVGQPALARAQKVFGRARRAGLDLSQIDSLDIMSGADAEGELAGGDSLGRRLAALAAEADAAGLDAEQALRAATRRLEERIRMIESEQSGRKET
jgi:XTP/dITP diphosphohydrolase